MEETQEYDEIMRKFLKEYSQLKKKYRLNMSLHFGWDKKEIEIWEMNSEGNKKNTICRVRRDSAIECYRDSLEQLVSYIKIFL